MAESKHWSLKPHNSILTNTSNGTPPQKPHQPSGKNLVKK